MAGGEAEWTDAVVLATEAHQAARIVRYLDPALALLLEGIPYASSATVALAYRREAIVHPLDGFGFVVPRVEGRSIIACTFSSVKYPGRAPDGYALLRLFFGGSLDEASLERDDEALARTARDEVAAILGARAEPLFVEVSRYPRAMAQYLVGHQRRVEVIESAVARHPGLALAGGAYRGVGLADCVHSGEQASDLCLAVLARPA